MLKLYDACVEAQKEYFLRAFQCADDVIRIRICDANGEPVRSGNILSISKYGIVKNCGVNNVIAEKMGFTLTDSGQISEKDEDFSADNDDTDDDEEEGEDW